MIVVIKVTNTINFFEILPQQAKLLIIEKRF